MDEELPAETIETLDHPSVVRLLRRSEARGLAFLVLEDIQGEDLERRLRRLDSDSDGMDPVDQTINTTWVEFTS